MTGITYALQSGSPLLAGSSTNNLDFSVDVSSDSNGASVSGSDLWQVFASLLINTIDRVSKYSKYSNLDSMILSFYFAKTVMFSGILFLFVCFLFYLFGQIIVNRRSDILNISLYYWRWFR